MLTNVDERGRCFDVLKSVVVLMGSIDDFRYVTTYQIFPHAWYDGV